MKRTVQATKTFEYEIDIDDKILNEEFVQDFERSFWELEGDTLDDMLNNLFEVVAYQLANGEEYFIEGVGRCGNVVTKEYWGKNGEDVVTTYRENYQDTETEML